MTRYLGHFDESQMPPHSLLQMDGYRGSNIFGISLKMLVDRMLGSQHLTLFMVEFQPGGEGNIHDHPFEEAYFFLSGEADAILDGKPYHVKAGDYVLRFGFPICLTKKATRTWKARYILPISFQRDSSVVIEVSMIDCVARKSHRVGRSVKQPSVMGLSMSTLTEAKIGYTEI